MRTRLLLVTQLTIAPVARTNRAQYLQWTADPALVGATRSYQLWFRDAQAYCTNSTFNLTHAVRIQWGS